MKTDKLEYEELHDGETSFVARNEYGDKTNYEILFTFEDEKTGKNYIVYTDSSVDDSGHTNVYASSFTLTKSGERVLNPIENELEMEIIKNALDEIQREFKIAAPCHI